MIALTFLAVVVQAALPDTTYMYRTTLIQAAPGRLSELMDVFKERREYFRVTDGEPFILRHSQGDAWDLMLIFPMGSMESYYDTDHVARRLQAEAGFGTRAAFEVLIAPLISWREDTFVKGPKLDLMRSRMNEGDFYHVEMFVALPGKRGDLIRERYMENEYLSNLGRPRNLVFTRVAGGEWDTFTIGIYRDIAHFAEGSAVPQELRDRSARAAGFEAAGDIGFYLRRFVRRHHDTLAGAVH